MKVGNIGKMSHQVDMLRPSANPDDIGGSFTTSNVTLATDIWASKEQLSEREKELMGKNINADIVRFRMWYDSRFDEPNIRIKQNGNMYYAIGGPKIDDINSVNKFMSFITEKKLK